MRRNLGWLAGLALIAGLAACGDYNQSSGRGGVQGTDQRDDADNDGVRDADRPGSWYNRDGTPSTTPGAPSGSDQNMRNPGNTTGAPTGTPGVEGGTGDYREGYGGQSIGGGTYGGGATGGSTSGTTPPVNDDAGATGGSDAGGAGSGGTGGTTPNR